MIECMSESVYEWVSGEWVSGEWVSGEWVSGCSNE